jgi:hypothetical protein
MVSKKANERIRFVPSGRCDSLILAAGALTNDSVNLL